MEYVKREDVRVNFGLAPGDKLIYCPYNRSHQVLEFKAARHLEACRKTYLKSGGSRSDKIVLCRWKPSKHHLPESQILDHEKMCEGNLANLFQEFGDHYGANVSGQVGRDEREAPKAVGTTEEDYWEDE